MKEKIRLALIAAYKNLGFSNEAIDAMVAFLETSVTAEDQVDAAVAGVGGMMAGFQKEVDRRANLYKSDAEKWQESQKKPGDPPKEKETPKMPDDTPPWAQALIDQNKKLEEKISAIEMGKSTDSRKAQLETVLKDAPDSFKKPMMKAFELMKFEKEEDFTNYLEGVKTDAGAFVQTETNTGGFSRNGRPIIPTSTGGASKAATKEELDEVMSKI